ncbi:DUF1508 domain-containing protein [Halorubrum sp. JWXQ-INN 858]|uniref:DUF1508 domain-containing protein n=1 Tax=Halorubrum sp. JWXQ-INN 858 TaxID=2690782 RepID=UPI00135BD04D|nr:DUF1508 domain-containing protein [Halorubrum sp. JWXQ-INN 858]MWV65617.1 DUF1508 domain-containing protein [Halorubrum sp. JWXQ-INN 858]
MSVLTIAALADAWRLTRARAARPIGGAATILFGTVALVVALLLAGEVIVDLPATVRIVSLTAGAQAFFVAIDVRISGASRSERVAVPFSGHLAVLLGSVLVLESTISAPRAALLAYSSGFAALSIHVFWMRQRALGVAPPRPHSYPRYWEAALLVAVGSGALAAVFVAFTAEPDPIASAPWAARPAAVIAGIGFVSALAIQAPAPRLPELPAALIGVTATATQHAFTTVVALNTLVLALLLADTRTFLPLLGGYLVLLTVAVVFEYAMVLKARQRLGRARTDPDPLDPNAPVTVVVSAANEASVLPESLSHNLEALPGVQFLLLPAAKSSDDTVAVAHEFREEYPDRVRVMEGTAGSKAGDLNAAWEYVETPFVLLLDADETVDAEFVSRGLARLETNPAVGVVQGRKAAKYPEQNALSRFVSADRQHSTWIEHPFMSEVFGAAHFAGSAAIFKREVPPAVGGWSPYRLTEDIDLTLRLLVDTDWRVAYDPEMVAYELNPTTVPALIRQRVRWARGWAQVTAKHGPSVVRSWRSLGIKRTLGVCWLLFASVSAPLYTVFPALLLLSLVGFASPLPGVVAVALALLLLPARGVSIAYATMRDPDIELPRGIGRRVRMLGHAYLWIPVGWVIQIHALYLQLAGAPGIWHVTPKRGQKTVERKSAERRRRPPAGSTTLRAGEPDEVPWVRARFEVYTDRAGEARFRLRHENGNVLADGGEGYASRRGVRRAITALRELVGPAAYLRCNPAGIEVYRDAGNEWQWRLVGPNGRALAESPTGYSDRPGAVKGARLARERLADDDTEPEMTRDGEEGYRWRLRAENGRPIARSVRSFPRERAARDSLARAREYAPVADLLDIGRAAFELYADRAGKHRFRLRHRNGNILLDSGQGYATRRGARDAVEGIRRYVPIAPVELLDGHGSEPRSEDEPGPGDGPETDTEPGSRAEDATANPDAT